MTKQASQPGSAKPGRHWRYREISTGSLGRPIVFGMFGVAHLAWLHAPGSASRTENLFGGWMRRRHERSD